MCFCIPVRKASDQKGSTLKRKEFAPNGEFLFTMEADCILTNCFQLKVSIQFKVECNDKIFFQQFEVKLNLLLHRKHGLNNKAIL